MVDVNYYLLNSCQLATVLLIRTYVTLHGDSGVLTVNLKRIYFKSDLK